jgi:hypothetical protein
MVAFTASQDVSSARFKGDYENRQERILISHCFVNTIRPKQQAVTTKIEASPIVSPQSPNAKKVE